MSRELAAEGHPVYFVAVNAHDAVEMAGDLSSQCRFPLLQDTDATGAWDLMGGGKDDFYIYNAAGTLVQYLPTPGGVDTNLSTTAGYANLKAAILAAE